MQVTLSTFKYSSLFLASLVFILASALFFPVLFAVVSASSENALVSEGNWQGLAHYANGKDVPFRFEIEGKPSPTGKIYLLNGKHEVESGKISQKGDSLFVAFEHLNNRLALKIDGKQLSGVLSGTEPGRKAIQVDAVFGQTASLVRK
jgi:hypothetical protein